MFASRPIRWFLKGLAALALVGLVALSVLLLLLRQEHNTELVLPAPTGRSAVGRTSYAWINNTESDPLAPSPGAKREVVVWIWYPAAGTSQAAPAEYLPAAWRQALARQSGVLMSQFFTRDLSLVHTHSASNPPVSEDERCYPVVILRAGGGAPTIDFTTLAEDLASHGYVVVGFDAPYRSGVVVLPDDRIVTRPPENDPENLATDQADRLINRLLPLWTDDVKFVVNQLQQLNAADPSGKFTGRLDMERLGLFGHSFGGAQALEFCHDDSRCKAGIDLDGAPYGSVIRDSLKQPFLFILSDHSRELSDPTSRQILANFQSIYGRLPSGKLFLAIRGANHFSFSDQMLLKSQYLIGGLRLLGFGRLGGRRGLAITADYVHSFFDVYLKGEPSSGLKGLRSKYPEVQLESP